MVAQEQFELVHRMAQAGASESVISATTGLGRPGVGRVVRPEVASLGRFQGAAQESELSLYESEE